MANTIKVKLGAKANIFSDPGTGIYITKGEVKELSMAQCRLPRFQKAFQGGHLVRAEVPDAAQAPVVPAESVLEKFRRLMDAGASDKKLEKAFSMESLKKAAAELDIEPEEGDTKADLIAAIKEEIFAALEEAAEA